MNEEYVTRAEFDAKVETVKVMIEDTNRRIDDVKAEIAGLRETIARGWTVVGVVAALGALFIALRGVI